ncbi:hypothetical protein BOTBODRAFT_182252 [Botryobasidium botryosum FD-172 SS1]|uniref:Ubiquitin-like protease family profile domain-containing protein n=1 Tax=Botryobasidium botryosum (strain FD-172 SS1) TaxID=930990 RepID=A0A067LU52_BOTB1|nr:hypothetical protein BOTBODRAFT_182252 [Botryobasidium botryosum FD-172 SS1]
MADTTSRRTRSATAKNSKKGPMQSAHVKSVVKVTKRKAARPKHKATTKKAGNASPPAPPSPVIFLYPFEGLHRIVVRESDLAVVQSRDWLTDTLVKFGTRFWFNARATRDSNLRGRIHLYDPYFFSMLSTDGLSQKSIRTHWDTVSASNQEADPLMQDYLLFPVHRGEHWILVIVFNLYSV